MATYFIDPINGNNSNNGLTFANRKLNIVGLTLAPNDLVKFIKSPDPVNTNITAAFTDLSSSVTLSEAVTQVIDNCDSVWTGAANVTATVNTTPGLFMEGTGCAQFAIAAAFTTGKIAHRDLGSVMDLSAYQQISFYLIGPTAAFSTTNLQIKLCSDTAGNTPVNTFTLPVGIQQSCMHAVTLNNGAPLGNNIRSIAIYTLADPAATTIRLDHVIACKAASDPKAITLSSMIGKNVAGDTFYHIQSITGTAVILGAALSTSAGSPGLLGYAGTTAAAAPLYRREVFTLATNGSSTVSTVGQITNSGTEGNPIRISGGWNSTDMSTQDGETWMSGNSVNNIGFRGSNVSWLTFEKFGLFRFIAGYYFTGGNNIVFENPICGGNFGYGIFLDGGSAKNTINNPRIDLQANYGLVLTGNNVVNNAIINGTRVAAVSFGDGSGTIINGLTAVKSEDAVIDFGYGSNHFIYDLISRDAVIGGVRGHGTQNFLINPQMPEAAGATFPFSYGGGAVYTHNLNTVGNHVIFMDGAKIYNVTDADRDVADGYAWRVDITSAIRKSNYPVIFGSRGSANGIRVSCFAGFLVTISARIKRSHANMIGRLVARGGQLAGVPSDVIASTSGAAGSYETVTLSFTPTANGVMEIEFQAYTTDGATTYSAWIDTSSIRQA